MFGKILPDSSEGNFIDSFVYNQTLFFQIIPFLYSYVGLITLGNTANSIWIFN